MRFFGFGKGMGPSDLQVIQAVVRNIETVTPHQRYFEALYTQDERSLAVILPFTYDECGRPIGPKRNKFTQDLKRELSLSQVELIFPGERLPTSAAVKIMERSYEGFLEEMDFLYDIRTTEIAKDLLLEGLTAGIRPTEEDIQKEALKRRNNEHWMFAHTRTNSD